MKSWKTEIEAILSEFWDEMAISLAEDPQDTSGLLGAPLDSLTAIEVLVKIDTLLGRTLPAEVMIQPGGYESKQQFVDLLSQQVLEYIAEHPHD